MDQIEHSSNFNKHKQLENNKLYNPKEHQKS